MAAALVALGGGTVAAATSDDLENVVANALCAFEGQGIPPVDHDKLIAYGLYLANETYCTLV